MKKETILIGVSGGIAAYKTCELVRMLVKSNYNTQVIMTEHAAEFVTPLTFKTLSNNPVFINMFEENKETAMPHISLSKQGDIMVIAPATANVIGKIANGIADDLLTTLCLSFPKKIILAPAMNEKMYENPIVRQNISKLKSYKDKYILLGPEKGDLACEEKGMGRMTDIKNIIKAVKDEIK